MSKRTFSNQFPADYAVPSEIAALAQSGKITDTSWGDDVCPSFNLTEDGGIRLWVGHPDPARREIKGKRFIIALYDEQENWLCCQEETDSLPVLLAYLRDQYDIAPTGAVVSVQDYAESKGISFAAHAGHDAV